MKLIRLTKAAKSYIKNANIPWFLAFSKRSQLRLRNSHEEAFTKGASWAKKEIEKDYLKKRSKQDDESI